MSQVPGYAPPPRSGKPWWVWALGGCGGCLLIVIIAMVAFGTWISSILKGAGGGPVTPVAIQKSLGVPIYPSATLNVQATDMTRRILGVGQRLTGKSLFSGIGAYTTQDSAAQVADFYKRK